ncbi:MAG: hypothetical protein ACI9UK_001332 [Candidatus Krumholzibacteriia bacterium]|jgi:hypothetical protein
METQLTKVAECDLGRGLFAETTFEPRQLIMKLTGYRYDRGHPIHRSAIGPNLLQTGWHTYILLTSPGVYANHSCNPNAGIADNRNLVAIRPILPGDEIFFDYSTTMDEHDWTMPCRCGEDKCRGVVRDFEELPASVQAYYLKLGVVQKFIAARFRHLAI